MSDEFLVGLLVGVFVGVFIGVLVLALVRVGSDRRSRPVPREVLNR
jgi:hypothetical protein